MDGAYLLAEALRDPDNIYIGLDVRLSIPTIENVYSAFKDGMIDAAREKHGLTHGLADEVEQAITNMILSHVLLDIPESVFIKYGIDTASLRSPDNLDQDIEVLRSYPEGSNILDTSLDSVVYDTDEELIMHTRPDLKDKQVEMVISKAIQREYVFNEIGRLLNSIEDPKTLTVDELIKKQMPEELHSYLKPCFERLRFIVGDVKCLPFKDNSLDYVRGSGVDWLYKDNPENLKEADRILKKGKIVYLAGGIDTRF